MNLKHWAVIIIVFTVLIGSDLFIGFYGHYKGATGEDESFWDYLAVLDWTELFVVFLVAIGVSLLVLWGMRQ